MLANNNGGGSTPAPFPFSVQKKTHLLWAHLWIHDVSQQAACPLGTQPHPVQRQAADRTLLRRNGILCPEPPCCVLERRVFAVPRMGQTADSNLTVPSNGSKRSARNRDPGAASRCLPALGLQILTAEGDGLHAGTAVGLVLLHHHPLGTGVH